MTDFQDIGGGVILFVAIALWWHYFAYSRASKMGDVGYLFFLLFIARGLIATLNAIYDIMPIQMDAIAYHTTASHIADLFGRGDYKSIWNGIVSLNFVEPGYTLLLGSFYFIFGKTPLVGFILNTFFFSLTAYNVYRMGSLCFDRKSGMIASLIFLMLPYSVLHSTYLYRDPIINYFLSEIFYGILLVTKGEKVNFLHWLWLDFIFLYTGILRRENLVILSAILAFLILRKTLSKKRLLTPIIIVSLCLILIGSAFIISQYSEMWLLKNFSSLIKVELISQRIESLEGAKSAYLVNEKINSWYDVIKYAPIRAIYFMFSPFTWDIFKKSQYISFGEAMLLLVALFFLPKALWKIKKENPAFFYTVALYLFVGIIGAGLIQSNSAGAQRHRTQFTFLIVATAVPYMYNTFLRRISLFGQLQSSSREIQKSSV
ncbi:MAG: hypothetical protein A2Y81_02285 [Nitrospirae bacterium RBG_13_43_8]|nr:MAG: hypothetical protein A2Y81_02285 [Nitrospirae bacterium RBG_13_43_8]